MALSKRLEAAIHLLSPCELAGDIGCDHAYVSIALIERKLAKRVIASDINEGPLLIAKKNIREAGLENCIEAIQYDGIGFAADAYMICGMGGNLMLKILKDALPTVLQAGELILQPQSELAMFRRELTKLGFEIVSEDMVFEDEKYYPMMKAVPAGKENQTAALSELQCLYGPVLLSQNHPVLHQFLLQQRSYLQELYVNLNATLEKSKDAEKNPRSRQRLLELEEEIRLNALALQQIEERRSVEDPI